jgi:hypothetical protein
MTHKTSGPISSYRQNRKKHITTSRRQIWQRKPGDTLSTRHVSSSDVTRAFGM